MSDNNQTDINDDDIIGKPIRYTIGFLSLLFLYGSVLGLQQDDISDVLLVMFWSCLSLASFTKGKAGHFFGSCIALSIIALALFYFIYTVINICHARESIINIIEPILFAVYVGGFSYHYLLLRKFGFGKPVSDDIN